MFIKKINPFSLFSMQDPPSLLFWSQRVISRGHIHISGKTVAWSLSKHDFDAIVAMGPVCFEWTHTRVVVMRKDIQEWNFRRT